MRFLTSTAHALTALITTLILGASAHAVLPTAGAEEAIQDAQDAANLLAPPPDPCPYEPGYLHPEGGVHSPSHQSDLKYEDFESNLVGPQGGCPKTIEELVDIHEVGGVNVAIIEAGEITQNHPYGHRDLKAGKVSRKGTLYQAASMSKFVASLGIVEAARLGKLSLGESVASVADDHPDSTLAEWLDEYFDDHEDWAQEITIKRLLNHTSGLGAASIGNAEPGSVPTLRDILLHKNPWKKGHVEPIWAPRKVRDYSGGGYVVAEHLLELHISRSFKEFLKEEILDPAGMTKSSFDKAQTSMGDLARGCSRDTCDWDVKQTNVKAPGGLLATAKEYAKLVTIFLNGGVDEDGTQVIPFENIEKIMTPAMHGDSSKIPCTDAESGDTRTDWREMCLGPNCFDLPYVEVCLLGMYRQPLYDVDTTSEYYSGLGVKMSTTLLDDGFPRYIYHGGAQDGFISNFKIDRKTGNGIVVMINGNRSWEDAKGFERGAEEFKSEIMAAWELVY